MTTFNFLTPFQLTTQGTVATTSDPGIIAMQRVKSLISTPTGSRVMLPNYGVNLPGYLFSPDITESATRIATDIITSMQTYEPSITILDVKPVINDPAEGIADIDVEFTQSTDATYTPTLTATVLVGGTVVAD